MKAARKQLGAYWGGTKAIYFVETTGTIPSQAFKVQIDNKNYSSATSAIVVNFDEQIISLIKNAFRHQNINPFSINLSLPSKDIIFRSFIIPWMQSHEVKGVVEFEASKYIPFALEELSYSYHPLNISIGETKKIRIIFVAIKKSALDYYTKIFNQCGLQINFIEPEPSSLIRALMFKNLLPKDQLIALVERGEESGKIIIIDQGIPQFVREFQFRIPPKAQESNDSKALMTLLNNEIRISLDYFNRQDSQMQVNRLLFISALESEELAKNLEQDLGMPIACINTQNILNTSFKEIGPVNGYGVSLVNQFNATVDFNLLKKDGRTSSMKMGASIKPQINYKNLFLIIACSAMLITISMLLSKSLLSLPQRKIASLSQKLGAFKEASADKLMEKNQNLSSKIAAIKNIRTRSEVSLILKTIPMILPKGAWITNLDITYSDPQPSKVSAAEKNKYKLAITFTGYAYVENTQEQFGLVNKLLGDTKRNSLFSSIFNPEKIELVEVKAQKLNEYTVTYYKIVCR